eukprot:gene11508-biopygen22892
MFPAPHQALALMWCCSSPGVEWVGTLLVVWYALCAQGAASVTRSHVVPSFSLRHTSLLAPLPAHPPVSTRAPPTALGPVLFGAHRVPAPPARRPCCAHQGGGGGTREKRQRTRTGRGPDAGRTIAFKETDADRTRTGRGAHDSIQRNGRGPDADRTRGARKHSKKRTRTGRGRS